MPDEENRGAFPAPEENETAPAAPAVPPAPKAPETPETAQAPQTAQPETPPVQTYAIPQTPQAPQVSQTAQTPVAPEAPVPPAQPVIYFTEPGSETPGQNPPQPGQAPAGGATPQPPYPYGYAQYTPYTPYSPYPPYPPQPPKPPRRRMKTGLKVLIGVLCGCFVLCLVGLGTYAAVQVLRSATGSAETHRRPDNFPEIDGFPDWDEILPSPDSTPAPSATPAPEADEYTPPDISVVPNHDGIQLNPVPAGAELDVADVYEKVVPSTVLVMLPDNGSSGSGIIATSDGYIITNSHVVLDSRDVHVQVQTNDGAMHEAVVVGCDKVTDLAVLKIDGTGYTPAEFGDSDALRMGQWVVAIGNPGGELFSGSITRGIISGLNRSVGSYSANGMTYIQTDAAINPGNSGGPLVNLYGQVVGINSAKIVSSEYEGMGFAIPISGAKAILDDLLSGGYVSGRVRFGIQGYALNAMQAAAANAPQGFVIAGIDEDSSFAGTDVQVYDIITAVNGVETPSLEALSNALLAYQPGDRVEVSLFRPSETGMGGTEFTVTVTLLADLGETQ